MKKNFASPKIGNKSNIKKEGGGTLKALVYGLIYFIAVLLVLSVILSLAFMYSDISETTVHVMYIAVLLVASLMGGFKAGRKCPQKGLVHGFAVGIAVCVLALIFTAVTVDISAYEAVIKSLVIMLATSIGGIIGVK